ncbi:MAG: hypothetical protein CVU10_04235 [Bacteroidetes bacterium HGW-Bacteroidetes-5]|jgi:hypothetical protein|nr:MAG: hypothetical protein CVU10_04235 [Bacteroidetes bacterium HGW-Bacteroidetes-5]
MRKKSTAKINNKESVKPVIICKNCDTSFQGHYCPNCGQSVKDLDIPFKVLIFDIMANMWAFDTRVFKTLKSLLFKPGDMALDYVAGRRARYMPPFRLYIFISFIFFLLLNISVTKSVNRDWDLLTVRERSDTVKDVRNSVISITKDSDSESDNKLKNFIEKIESNKGYYVTRFLTILSWSMFLLMPLYAFFLWLLFRKNQRFFLGHFIFAINQHALLFIIFITLLSINLIFPHKSTFPESWLLLLFPIYIVIGSRKLYSRKWISTILRLTTVQFMYMLVLSVAIAAVAYLTLSRVLGSS